MAALLVTLRIGLCAVCACADEFRVDTMVFADERPDAICQTVTLFTDNRIYDRLSDERVEVTMIDLADAKITILDLGKQIRSELSFDAINTFVRDANAAARSSPAFVSFAARPRFETVDELNGTLLVLRGANLSYRVDTRRAPNDKVAQQLKDFTDWSARLNTMRPGLPPGARLELNRRLFERKRIPNSVTCDIVLDVTDRRTFTSRHEYSWQLSTEDQAQIACYDRFSRDYAHVDLPTFLASPAAQQ